MLCRAKVQIQYVAYIYPFIIIMRDVNMLLGLRDIVGKKYRKTICSFQILAKMVHKKLSTTVES